MKKVSLLFLLIPILSTGCNLVKSEEEASERLVGYWEDRIYQEESGVTVKHIYHFVDIDNYRRREVHFSADGESFGFRVYEEGEYVLIGDRLVIGEFSVYVSENEILYSTIEELKNSTSPYVVSKSNFRTQFENDDQKVTLYYECPPNALCAEPPVLKKLGVIFN